MYRKIIMCHQNNNNDNNIFLYTNNGLVLKHVVGVWFLAHAYGKNLVWVEEFTLCASKINHC